VKKKLTPNEVNEIRTLYFKGNITQKEIAEKYNVSKSCVNSILANKTYKPKQ
tara:strand:+ start:461 stop:616 length:156 start_codon:yes stop_codon:yes gene_type:complete